MSKQTSGDNSTNIQAGRDIVQNNNVILYSIEEVAKKLQNHVFGELPDITKHQIDTNQKSYFNVLSENLSRIVKNQEEVKKIIDTPDFQYISKMASISASKTSSVELHTNLAKLIVDRVNVDSKELQRIVYNEAIKTIEKLTKDQLKIITLVFLLKHARWMGINTIDEFNKYLEIFRPFIDFKDSLSEYQHIQYTGCGIIGIMSYDILKIFKQNYSDVFSEDANMEEILKDNQLVQEIKKVWEKYPQKIELSSVGIVIAITYLEQITNRSMNIDIWIN